MNQKIYYEDNIFYVTQWITTLSDGIRLKLDPDLYRKTISRDIFSIEEILEELFIDLKAQNHLIHRNEYLHQTLMAMQLFDALLNAYLHDDILLKFKMEELKDTIEKWLLAIGESMKEIRRILKEARTSEAGSEERISNDEMRSLLETVTL